MSRDLLDAQNPVLDWWALASALHRLASTISMMVVLLIGAYLVTHGELRIGDVVAFTGFATLLISRLDQIIGLRQPDFRSPRQARGLLRARGFGRRSAPSRTACAISSNVTGHVRFENVGFEFANSGQGVDDVSFEVQAGQTVAIVGPTGAGKTTLINLLQRVYDAAAGPHPDRRHRHPHGDPQVAAPVDRHRVPGCRPVQPLDRGQHPHRPRRRATMTRSMPRPMPPPRRISSWPRATATTRVVGERGGQLSGGERQRIAIARAMLKDAPILVLDEATSALDVETEARVKEAIDELRRDRTTFIIAHRLTTVRDADLVVFMDKGRVVEMGGFAELSPRNGRFAALLRAGGLLNDEEVRRLSRIAVEDAGGLSVLRRPAVRSSRLRHRRRDCAQTPRGLCRAA